MRDYAAELEKRAEFIRHALDEARATGIIYANSGGKDCTLVGYLCKHACANTVGVMLPCFSKRNYGEDITDALAAAAHAGIETRRVDLTAVRQALLGAMEDASTVNDIALMNIAPRLRMVALYALANSENRLVAGTGNLSETHMGYFTKWGDGAYDFNPIADLTVTEVYEFLRFFGASESIIRKAPSAGLFDGQTDEGQMGITYAAIDRYIKTGEATAEDMAIINRYHNSSHHKRRMPNRYGM